MTKQEFKTIVKEVIKEDVDPKFDQIRTEMADMRTDSHEEMTDMRTDLQSEMTDMKTDLQTEMVNMKTDLQSEMVNMKIDLEKSMDDKFVKNNAKLEKIMDDKFVKNNAKLEKSIADTISRQFGMFEEHFLSEFKTCIEYTDSKNEVMNHKIMELEKNQKRNFDLLCVHDRKLEALQKE